eukprot:6570807-Pyramimonas_sp.AAC.1
MMRMARLLKNDPACKVMPEEERTWYSRTAPPLVNLTALPQGDAPGFQTRRRIMCNGAVGAVDGFKVQALLAFRHVCGMRICMDCPNCARCDNGLDFCADADGLVTEVEGGALGRMLTLVGTSEFQKKRGEHVYYQ